MSLYYWDTASDDFLPGVGQDIDSDVGGSGGADTDKLPTDDAGWEVHESKNNFQKTVRRLRIIFLFQLDAVLYIGKFAVLDSNSGTTSHIHNRQSHPFLDGIARLCQVGPWRVDTGLLSLGKRWACWGDRCWLQCVLDEFNINWINWIFHYSSLYIEYYI